MLDNARDAHVARGQLRKIGARTDALDDVRGQAFLEGHRRVHDPLEGLRHVARGDQNGELAQVSGEGALEAQVLAQASEMLCQRGVVHQGRVGSADLAALGRDAVVDRLRLGRERTQDVGEPGHETQRPLNCGSRFSTKARAASRWSSVMPVRVWCQASRSSWSLREPDSAAFMLRFMYRRATRGPFAIFRASAIVSSSSVPSGTTRL